MAMLKRKSKLFRTICFLLAFLLVQNSLEQVQAQPTPFLPSPNSNFLELSSPYSFPVIRGMRVYPNKPFEFDFVVDSGDRHALDKKETSLLIKYFLTFLTIPEEDLWVNLSPYESGRIIPDDMALTDAGNTLLEQDKVLKLLSSSLTYPESQLGKKFWVQVYKKAFEKYGTTDLPVNTYNKVWIVPDKAIIYDLGNSALIGDTHLKVMLEEDYLALKKNRSSNRRLHTLTSEITKEIILPELQKEINEGKNFAPVRQLFHSLVLADWFKRELRRNILSDVYVNKKKISGVDDVDKGSKEKIYKEYLNIFKKGAYNYIREDVDPITNQVVPRKYFSGGEFFGDSAMWAKTIRVFKYDAIKSNFDQNTDSASLIKVQLSAIGGDLGMLHKVPQVRVSTLGKLALIAGFAAVGSLHAMDTTQMPNGNWQMKVDNSKDTLSQFVVSAGEQRHLWRNPGAFKEYWNNNHQVLENQGITKSNKYKIVLGRNYTLPPVGSSSAPQEAKVPSEEPNGLSRRFQAPNLPGGALNGGGRGYAGNPAPSAPPDTRKTETPEGPILVAALGATPVPARTSVPAAKSSLENNTLSSEVAPLPATPKAFAAPASGLTTVVNLSRDIKTSDIARKSYTLPKETSAMPLPYQDSVFTKQGGVANGFDLTPNKKVAIGDVLGNFSPSDLLFRIEGLRAQIQILENRKASLENSDKKNAAYADRLLEVGQQLDGLNLQLTQALNERKFGDVIATHNFIVKDWKVYNGTKYDSGTEVASYLDLDRYLISFNVRRDINFFNDMELGFENNPVTSYITINREPTNDNNISRVNEIVTFVDHVRWGKRERLFGTIHYSNNNSPLAFVKGKDRTSTFVGPVEEYLSTAYAEGVYDFTEFGQEGAIVQKGRLQAHLDVSPYQRMVDQILEQIRTNEEKLRLDAPQNGAPTTKNPEIDRLNLERAQLDTQLKINLDIIAHANVNAPDDLRVVWSNQNKTRFYKEGSPLILFNRGTTFLGNLLNAQNAIMFSEADGISYGDPVVIQTPEGTRILAQVVGIKEAFASSQGLPGKIYIEVGVPKGGDAQYVLQSKVKEEIIIPTPQEKQKILAMGLLPPSTLAVAAAGAPPPPKNPFGNSLVPYLAERPSILRADQAMTIGSIAQKIGIFMLIAYSGVGLPLFAQELSRPPQPYFIPQGNVPVLTLKDLRSQVIGDKINAGPEEIDAAIKKAEANKIGAKKIGIEGKVIQRNGTFSFEGGVLGSIKDWSAGLLGGNAINPAAALRAVVLTIAGDISSHFLHTLDKQKRIAQITGTIFTYRYQAKQLDQAFEAENLLIDLDVVQQRIAQLKGLLREKQKAQEVLQEMARTGEALQTELNDYKEKKVAPLEAEILKKEKEEKILTGKVNTSRGLTDLRTKFNTHHPLKGVYTPIPKDKIGAWRELLLGPNSPDPVLQALFAELDIKQRLAQIQRDSHKPVLQLLSLFSNSQPGNALADFDPGTWLRTANWEQGNAVLNINWNIIDRGRDSEDYVVQKLIEQVQVKIEKRKRFLNDKLNGIDLNTESLAAQIQKAKDDYTQDSGNLIFKDDLPRGKYLETDVISDLETIDQTIEDRVAHEADFLRQEAELRRLGLLKDDEFLVQDHAMRSDQAQAAYPSFFSKLALIAALAVTPIAAQQTAQLFAQHYGGLQSTPAEDSYGNDVAEEGARSEGGDPLVNMENKLNDPNPLTAWKALQDYLGVYQDDDGHDQSFIRAVEHARHPEIRQELFRHMVGLQKNALPFFVQISIDAERAGKGDLLELAFQSLDDVFTHDPQILRTLTEDNFLKLVRQAGGPSIYPDVNRDTVRRVFVTYLYKYPNSIATDLLLRYKYLEPKPNEKDLKVHYNYWTPDDLAKVYNWLTAYAKQNPRDNQIVVITGLAGLVQDAIVANEAPKFKKGVFNKGPYEDISYYSPDDDFYNYIWIERLEDEDLAFVRRSARWRDFTIPGKINHDLLVAAQASAQRLIDENKMDTKGGAKVPNPLFDLSSMQGEEYDFHDRDEKFVGKYIRDMKNISILARMLGTTPYYSKVILDRLMATPEGRFLVKREYVREYARTKGKDSKLLKMIEDPLNCNWQGFVKPDIETIEDSITAQIDETFLNELYDRTKQGWILDMLLKIRTWLKLHWPNVRLKLDSI